MKRAEAFLDQYPVKKVARGEVLLHQSDIPDKAYVIKSGIIKVCNLTSNGEEKSLSFKVEDDLFPVCWIFSKTKTSLFYYQAHTDCELYLVDKEKLVKHID